MPLFAAIATLAIVGCTEPSSPGIPPPVTLVPPPACEPTIEPQGATVAVRDGSGSDDETVGVPEELARHEVIEAAEEAAESALAPDGTGDVVVVTVDDDGRPDFETAPAAEAVEMATGLADDRGVRVVAVDAVGVMSIAADGVEAMSAPMADDPLRSQQWGMTDLQVEDAWEIATGDGVDIAIVDTGVRASHPDLEQRICGGAAFLRNAVNPVIGGGAVDGNGHGTHVAGTAAAAAFDLVGVVGVAPEAGIIPVRVLGNNGSGFTSDVAKGIIWAVDHGADVVNLSLGGPDSSDVSAAVSYAISQGVVVVAAAGNDGVFSQPNYPAAIPAVLAVASYDSNRVISSFSSHGAYVDVAAPGGNILSTSGHGSWTWKSGTSMATPHVAGIAALLLESEPGLSPLDVRLRIEGTATDAGEPGYDVAYGHGIVSTLDVLNP